MPKFSAEGRVGLIMEILVFILERLNVTAGYIIWPLFGFGALLIADWIWRGEWRQEHNETAVKKRVGIYSAFALISLSVLGVWLVHRIRFVEKTQDSARNTTPIQSPQNKAPDHPVEPQVKPTPQTKPSKKKGNPVPAQLTQNCPNGNCIGGDNNGTAIVNNVTPEPNISFVLAEDVSKESHLHPRQCIKISVDRAMDSPRFAVLCDHACTAAGGSGVILSAAGGQGGGDRWGSLPGFPNVAAFIIGQPNPMPSNVKYHACIESGDDEPVKILGVRKLILTNDTQ